jgi:hypothetical protein
MKLYPRTSLYVQKWFDDRERGLDKPRLAYEMDSFEADGEGILAKTDENESINVSSFDYSQVSTNL